MADDTVPYRYNRASEPDHLAIRTFHRSSIRIPRFFIDDLEWTPGETYSITRHDGHHIVRHVGEAGDTQLSAKKDGSARNVHGYELYPSQDDVPWRQHDDVVLEVRNDNLRLRDPTDADYDTVHEDAIRRQGHFSVTGRTVFDLYEDRMEMDVSDHLSASAFSNVWFTDDWLFADVAFNKRHRAGFNVPAPILLPTFFETTDAVGVAPNGDGCWYLCPPEDGEFTMSFSHPEGTGIRLDTRTFPSLSPGDRVHITYDPTGDTLVFYTIAASPFPNPAVEAEYNDLHTPKPYSG